MIVPCTSEDDYPTHDSKYGLGGWHEVSTLAERNAIPTERRRLGMACFVREDNTLYILKGNLLNTSWQPYIGISTPDVSAIINDAIQAGQVQINTDLSNYYTSDQVDQILADTATAQEIEDAVSVAEENVKTWVKGQNYLTQHQSLDDYMTEEEIMAELDTRDAANKEYVDTALTDYYTKEVADDTFLTIAKAAEVYLSLEDFETFKTDNAADIEAVNVEIRTIKNDYATKAEVEGKGYITSETVDDILGEKGYLTSLDMQQYLATNRYVVVTDLDGFATKDYVTNTLTMGHYLTLSDLSGYATEAWTTDQMNNSGFLKIGDLTGYATEAWVKDYVALNGGGGTGGGGEIDLTSYVKKTELTAELANYYTKTNADQKFALKSEIPEAYTLPTASTETLGGVKVDGTTITIADGVISAVNTGGSETGTTDYTQLTNKPQIGGVELTGNKTLIDLGIQPAGDYLVETDLADYAKTTDIPTDYLTEADLTGYATTADLEGYVETGDLAGYAQTSSLSTVATSGSYNDLTNKPTIVTSYNDLTDKPSIPEAYTLPTASTSTLGGVKVDGTTITIEDGVITSHATSTGGTTDYTALTNKPRIGGVELTGNKTLAELGIQAEGDYLVATDLADYAQKSEIPTDYLTADDLAGYAQTSAIPTATSDLTNDSGFITASVNNLANYTLTSALATVATSGSYNDLTNKPSIPEAYTLPTASTTTLGGVKVDGTTVTIEDGVISAHATSTGGTSDYVALTNKPQIGGVELTGNKSLSDLGIQPAGTYLTEIPAEYVTETELNGKGYLTAVPAEYVTETELNGKGYLTSADLEGYAQTSDIPTATSDLTNDSGFITNSVNNLTNYTLTSGLAAVATSGSYNDLSNKPTIITSYNDLTDKPSIPSAYVLPTASTTTLGGVKIDGTTITISGGVISAPAASVATASTTGVVKPDDVTIGIEEDGTLVNNSAGCNCYIYGVNGIGSDDITIAADTTTTISTGRLRNFNEGAGNRIKVGDVLIDVKGNVAKIDRVNTAPADPDEWLFGVDESSVLIKLQLREDETLTTTSKEIVGAINELVSRIAALEARVTALETPTA